ncbi:NPC intracellular cholesterol transporter 2-like isoform 1-T2 [Anableps anableps]
MDVRTGVIALFCLMGLTLAQPVKYIDCGSTSGKVVSVEIIPCPIQPCELHRGDSYTVNINFTSNVESDSSTAVVHGIVGGIPIPFAIPVADGCKSGIHCPIKKGETYNYQASLPIKTEYPSIKCVVMWELKDDGRNDLFCIKFPIQIVN